MTPSEFNSEAARFVAIYDQIYIPYTKHIEFHARCDFLQKLGQYSKGSPQKGFRVLAPSGSGKTSAAQAYIRLAEKRTPRTADFIPVLYVALDANMTSKKLMIAILEQYGDGFATHGTEQLLIMRTREYIKRFGTQLLIIDEVQHLNSRVRGRSDVTDSLKRLLDGGVVPVVFLGTEEATDMFQRNLQLNGRLLEPCDFDPLQADDPGDQALLAGYVERLDRAMVDVGVVRHPANFHVDAWVLGGLHAVSNGVVGRVSRLFHSALEMSLRRDGDRLEVEDLAEAVDRWAIPQAFIKFNPFHGERGQ
ncbi:TniB family NTP-binding protein [Caulobacter sp. BE254]|uniref:TniB family NTP-binding protein n=1 Tax=Caulobacter sp. BE254 TaxID=2817720 RepID=UPI00285C6699|nr:TniB family NTP-binding protein [Caulobacter sp. BE254]MDR7115618.1 hypothetical protein [Caulobacter sp. BE254]